MHSFNYSDWAEAYLTGKLSASEQQQFEAELFSNESLRDELAFQQDIIEGLQQTRRATLKARLDALPVPGQGVIGSAIGDTALKVAAGIAGTLVVSAGLYFFLHQGTAQEAIRQIELSQQPIASPVPAKPAAEDTEPATTLELEPLTEEKASADNSPLASTKEVVTSGAIEKASNTQDNSIKNVAPEINRPNLISFDSSEEQIQSTNEVISPPNPLGTIAATKTMPLEVTTQQHEWYNFHYRFMDNRLHLYGDFGQLPYEILEISTANGSRYYLFHNSLYFDLLPERKKFTKLKPITDSEIIRELEINRQLKN